MSRRVEMNPGEWFMVADRTILVLERESVLGMTGKIGAPTNQLAYFFTFAGRLNNSTETDAVTVAMSVEDTQAMLDDILHGLELLAALARRQGEEDE